MNAVPLTGSAPSIARPSVKMFFLVLAMMSLTSTGTPTAKGEERPSHPRPVEESVDLAPGGNYQSETILHIPGKGFTFTIPHGWHATVFEDSELPFLISDEGRGLGMIFPLASVTADVVEHELDQPLALSQGVLCS